jgi:heme-degrading monooxygenase HmoA
MGKPEAMVEKYMLLERAEILIKDGEEAGFAAAMKLEGIPMLASVPGVIAVNMGQGVENPGKFMLLVEWENMEAHAAYNKSPVCADFRVLIRGFSKGGAMEHFRMGDA